MKTNKIDKLEHLEITANTCARFFKVGHSIEAVAHVMEMERVDVEEYIRMVMIEQAKQLVTDDDKLDPSEEAWLAAFLSAEWAGLVTQNKPDQ